MLPKRPERRSPGGRNVKPAKPACIYITLRRGKAGDVQSERPFLAYATMAAQLTGRFPHWVEFTMDFYHPSRMRWTDVILAASRLRGSFPGFDLGLVSR